MLPFVTTQAIAASQAKKSRAPRASGAATNPELRATKRRRVLDALTEARMRKAEIEIEHHRRFYQGHTK